jgi:hypothetical protein
MRREIKLRPRRTEAEQHRLIKEQRSSGLSVRDFCERHQLRVSTFHSMRRRVDGRKTSRSAVANRPVVELHQPGRRITEDKINLRMQGYSLQFSPKLLSEVLRALKEANF